MRTLVVVTAAVVGVGAVFVLAFFFAFSPSTTTARTDAGTVYFQCLPSLTGRLWITADRWSDIPDSTQDYEVDTEFTMYRSRGDTLEVFTAYVNEPPAPALNVPIRFFELDGYERGRLIERAQKEGLQVLNC